MDEELFRSMVRDLVREMRELYDLRPFSPGATDLFVAILCDLLPVERMCVHQAFRKAISLSTSCPRVSEIVREAKVLAWVCAEGPKPGASPASPGEDDA